MNQTKIKILG